MLVEPFCDDQPSVLRTEPIIEFKRKLELPTGWVTLPLPDPPERQSTLTELIDIDDGQEWWNEAEVKRHYEMMSGLHRGKVDEILALKKRWVSTIFRRIREKSMRAEVRFDGLSGCLRTPRAAVPNKS